MACKPTVETVETSHDTWVQLEEEYETTAVSIIIKQLEKLDKFGPARIQHKYRPDWNSHPKISQKFTKLRNLHVMNSAKEVWDLFETWFLYKSCGPGYCHLKQKIKNLEFTKFKPERIENLANAHSSIETRPLASPTQEQK